RPVPGAPRLAQRRRLVVLRESRPFGAPRRGGRVNADAVRAGVPRTFRRESRAFLWIALLLILFLNFLTLLFFRNAVDWGSDEAARRSAEILRRVALSSSRPEGADDAMERGAVEPDVAYLAVYDEQGGRLRSFGAGPPDAPARPALQP